MGLSRSGLSDCQHINRRPLLSPADIRFTTTTLHSKQSFYLILPNPSEGRRTMLIQGNVKNLRSVKCFIVEEATTEDEEKELSVKTNPFLPGGRVSQDGERILELWREGRLSQYSKYQKQEGEINPNKLTGTPNVSGENCLDTKNVTLEQKKEKLRSLCCWGSFQ